MKRIIILSVLILLVATACFGGGNAGLPTSVPVAVLPTRVPTQPPTTLPTLVPSPTSAMAPTATALTVTPSPAPSCDYGAAFVADVTIEDDTAIPPGVQFVKTWRILNSGTCVWPPGTELVFDGGSQMNASPSAVVPPAEPGEVVDVTVRFRTPPSYGTYTSYWRIQLPQGERLGQRFYTRIIVPTRAPTQPPATAVPTSAPTSAATSTPSGTAAATAVPTVTGGWVAEYYANNSLSGAPRVTRTESSVNFDWGSGSPSNQIPGDDFSARWTRSLAFVEGTYRFEATMDDGMRIFIDGTKVMDEWRNGAERTVEFDYALSAGIHTIVVEYYEALDQAVAQFSWGLEGTEGLWRALYWDNKDLSGDPVVETQVAAIDMEWGLNGPPGVPVSDGFSASYSLTIDFEPGTYNFVAWADDGVRVFVDGNRVINKWRDDSGDRPSRATVALDGEHEIVVQHYDNVGNSFIRFSYERAGN